MCARTALEVGFKIARTEGRIALLALLASIRTRRKDERASYAIWVNSTPTKAVPRTGVRSAHKDSINSPGARCSVYSVVRANIMAKRRRKIAPCVMQGNSQMLQS